MYHLERWQASQLCGRILIPEGLLKVVLDGMVSAVHQLADSGERARQMRRTHQPKRQPSATTLDLLARIKPLKEAGLEWRILDRRLSLKSGTARQIWRDAKRRGWRQ